MTQSNFKKIAQLEVSHYYFEKNVLNSLEFVPSKATQQMITRFGFMIRKNTNGFDLYVNSTNTVETELNYISKVNQASFEFEIINHDPAFSLYTELPAGPILLTYDTGFTENIFEDGAQILKEHVNNSPATSQLGLLILRFADILKLTGTGNPARFCISYKARATQWQYYIINKCAIPLNNLAIVGENSRFDGPKEVIVGAGEPALLFTSDTLLPLSKITCYRFDLVSGSEGAPQKTIIKGLPNPDGNRLLTGEGVFFSPIYVYI